jgi:hypothetical protein
MAKTRRFCDKFTFKVQAVHLEQLLKNELFERKGIELK